VWERKPGVMSRFERERLKWEQAGLKLDSLKHPKPSVDQPTSNNSSEEQRIDLVTTVKC